MRRIKPLGGVQKGVRGGTYRLNAAGKKVYGGPPANPATVARSTKKASGGYKGTGMSKKDFDADFTQYKKEPGFDGKRASLLKEYKEDHARKVRREENFRRSAKQTLSEAIIGTLRGDRYDKDGNIRDKKGNIIRKGNP